MIMQRLLIGIILLFILSGCSKNDSSKSDTLTARLLDTAQKEYPALQDQIELKADKADGYHGLVHIFSRHYFIGSDRKGKEARADFVVHGTGSLLSAGGKYYVLTAKHVVIPNLQTREIKAGKNTINFEKMTSLQSQVLMGGLAVQPESIIIGQDDICFLTVADEDYAVISNSLFKVGQASESVGYPRNDVLNPGREVEAWGFPAKYNPQLTHSLISAVNERQIILNKALRRGYSGGPAFIYVGKERKKYLIGMIIRADEQDDQSVVLPVMQFMPLLESPKASDKSMLKIARGDALQYNNVNYRFLNYY